MSVEEDAMASEGTDREDFSRVRAAAHHAAERCALLIEQAPDASARLPRSEWTVRDLAAHIVLGTEVYREYAAGRTEPFVDVSDWAGGSLARTSAQRLVEEQEQNLQALATRLRNAAEALLEFTADYRGDEQVVWHGRIEIDVRSLIGILLGEYLVHGYDLARLLNQRWPIDGNDARVVLEATRSLPPLMADPRTTARVHASFDLRVRGGTQYTLRIDHGRVTTDVAGGPVDCHVSADPVALLFVVYGRQSPWGPILSGRMLAWGRKPWLGLRLTSYLVAP
jgi:uncharacterized protein (TIGR03083 family)